MQAPRKAGCASCAMQGKRLSRLENCISAQATTTMASQKKSCPCTSLAASAGPSGCCEKTHRPMTQRLNWPKTWALAQAAIPTMTVQSLKPQKTGWLHPSANSNRGRPSFHWSAPTTRLPAPRNGPRFMTRRRWTCLLVRTRARQIIQSCRTFANSSTTTITSTTRKPARPRLLTTA